MEDRVRVGIRSLELVERLPRRQDQQLDAPALGFLDDLVRHRQGSARPTPDHEPSALPGDVLGRRERRVAEPRPEGLGRPLPTLADRASVDHEVVLVGHAIDLDRPEREPFEAHRSR